MKRFPAPCLVVFLAAALWAVPAAGDILADAVVRLNATIPDQARTAGSLGTEREGNGIAIS